MRKYNVNWDCGNIFIIPDIAEKYLKLATGKAVKVLIEVMKHKEASDIKRICKNTGVPEEDVEEALSFWYQAGVLSIERKEPSYTAELNNEAKTHQNLSYSEQVCQSLGIKRVLNDKEQNLIQKWEQSGITLEEIAFAAEKTRRMTGKTSFAYMDKIFEK